MDKIVLPTLDQVLATIPHPAPREIQERIYKAHEFAAEHHGNRKRNSGELYIEHDRAVAHAMGLIRMDIASTTAGLLHDTLKLEDLESPRRIQQMEGLFGKSVAGLVTGIQKLDPYTTEAKVSRDQRKLEKLRRAILNVVDDDIRILLLRMADNLQDLHTADTLPRETQLAVAHEASEIYAPIANRLGIWTLKWQLEDGAFRFIEPEIYAELDARVSEHRAERDAKIKELMHRLRVELEKNNIKAQVTGRPKHIYSIHRKMQRKNVPFEEIYDLRAVRVLLEENNIGQCYQVLGIVHHMWLPIPEEFDDYIANPKPNGYRSLHTAVYDDSGQVLEVQIRTRAMDDEAERGIAAHWAYKEAGKPSQELTRRVEWLRHLLIDLRNEESEDSVAKEPMINIDDLSKRIYVFTPKRDLIELPEGGTPVDFAYRVHTQVGHRCRGAIVNGKMVPLNYQLEQGDTVHIILAKRGGPSRDWMNEKAGYVKSGRTRSKVRQWFRVHDREQNIEQGRSLIERELRQLRLSGQITIEELAQFFKLDDVDDFLARLGFGDIQFNQVTGAIALLQEKRRQEEVAEEVAQAAETPRPPTDQHTSKKGRQGIRIEGLTGLYHTMAQCCLPLPPEPIAGYVTRGHGVTIHSKFCKQFVSQALKEPGRVMSVEWGADDKAAAHDIALVVSAYRHPELAEDVATLVSGRHIKIKSTKSVTDKKGLTTLYIIVHLRDLEDLDWLMQKLRNMTQVIDVKRQR